MRYHYTVALLNTINSPLKNISIARTL